MAICFNCEHPTRVHGDLGCTYPVSGVDCTCPMTFQGAFDELRKLAAHQAKEPAIKQRFSSARDGQVGGEHYRNFKIQPWDVWEEYGLDPWLANAVKYLLRAGRKGPKVEDLKKARHYLDRAIERAEVEE